MFKFLFGKSCSYSETFFIALAMVLWSEFGGYIYAVYVIGVGAVITLIGESILNRINNKDEGESEE